MKNNFYEIIGWIGMGLIFLAYLLVSIGTIESDMLVYQFLNFIGAIGIIIISYVKKAYPPAVLNILWATIAILAIVGIVVRN